MLKQVQHDERTWVRDGWLADAQVDIVLPMNRLAVAFAINLAIGACTTIEPISEEDRTFEFRCDDVVVIGRLYDQVAQDSAPIEGDLIGHGWIAATIAVRRVVRGEGVPSRMAVKYFAHTYTRDDRDFMFVLQRAQGSYEVATAQLMSVHPRPATTCE